MDSGFYLVTYMWKRRTMTDWGYDNAVIAKDPADWLLEMMQEEEYYILLWAREITEAQYQALEGHVN